MKSKPQPIQQSLHKLTSLQTKLRQKGIPALTDTELQQEIAKQDKQRFQELATERKQQHQKTLSQLLSSSDVNPCWTMNEVQRLLHRRDVAHDFAEGFRTLNQLCEYLEHHEGSGGVCWMLLGAFGRGKSTLAGAMYHEYIHRGKTAIMIQWQQLVRIVWGGGEPSKRLLDQVYKVDLLVLDEVGYDSNDLREQEKLLMSTIIRNRKSNCRSLVLCSNHYPATFEQAIGTPSTQGLRDYKTYTSVFEGQSHRQDLFKDLEGNALGMSHSSDHFS
jgi:DNA replication protein DnaC